MQGNPTFNYDLSNSYGSIDLDMDSSNRNSNSDGNHKNMEGTVGSGVSKARVTISNKYANISISRD